MQNAQGPAHRGGQPMPGRHESPSREGFGIAVIGVGVGESSPGKPALVEMTHAAFSPSDGLSE